MIINSIMNDLILHFLFFHKTKQKIIIILIQFKFIRIMNLSSFLRHEKNIQEEKKITEKNKLWLTINYIAKHSNTNWMLIIFIFDLQIRGCFVYLFIFCLRRNHFLCLFAYQSLCVCVCCINDQPFFSCLFSSSFEI